MDNEFLRFEKIGRDKAKNEMDNSSVPITYYFTELENPLDLFLTALSKTYAVEIKNRPFKVERFEKDGLILEPHKYKTLMEAWENSGYTPIYLNYFEDCRIEWDVRTIGNIEDVILLLPSEGKVKWYS